MILLQNWWMESRSRNVSSISPPTTAHPLEHNSSDPNPGSLPSHGHHARALIPHDWLHFVTESCQWIGLLCIATSPVSFLNYIQPQNGKGVHCFVLAVVGVGTFMVPVSDGMKEYLLIIEICGAGARGGGGGGGGRRDGLRCVCFQLRSIWRKAVQVTWSRSRSKNHVLHRYVHTTGAAEINPRNHRNRRQSSHIPKPISRDKPQIPRRPDTQSKR